MSIETDATPKFKVGCFLLLTSWGAMVVGFGQVLRDTGNRRLALVCAIYVTVATLVSLVLVVKGGGDVTGDEGTRLNGDTILNPVPSIFCFLLPLIAAGVIFYALVTGEVLGP